MRSTHSAAACRVSWHSDARLRKPCGRSSTTRNVTGLPMLRSRRANMTESSSIGSSAHACKTVGWGTGKGRMSQGKGGTRGHSADRGGRHDGEVQNEFNGAPWTPARFSLPPENYHLFSLSLTLPALRLLLSPVELHKIAKENGSPDSLLVVHLSSQARPPTPTARCTCTPPVSSPSGAHHDVHWWQALQHAVRCQQW